MIREIITICNVSFKNYTGIKGAKMKTDSKRIVKQGQFCKELANRLCERTDKFRWDVLQDNHTQIQKDIVRLRRELMDLSKMLNPYE